MSDGRELEAPPAIEVAVVSERTIGAGDGGFLRIRRLELQNTHPDGRRSRVYRYDAVERDAIDAVGIVLEARLDGERWVCLRSSLRPPLGLRGGYALPLEERVRPTLWEIPAGLVEPAERGEEGLRRCAARETLEEVGLELEPSAFGSLGPPFTLSPGVLGERLYLLHAVVDPTRRGEPELDGSPTEEGGVVRFVPLAEALAAAADGRIEDAKTEVALHRLALRGERPR